ncbi:MAG: DUF4143 domain-containing protein, partial [Promicromonosporaceae bacterium]|nr:DUF4143 domain-containing protein [Promicromonosporaceae bacterium]
PGILNESTSDRQRSVNDYVDYLMQHDVSAVGGHVRRPQFLRTWLRAYAAATSSTASQEAISMAVDRNAIPSRKTISEFRGTLERLWLLDPVPAWQLGAPRLNQMGRAPKHHLADPALAAALLATDATRLLRASGPGDSDPGLRNLHHGPLLGALFESLVTLSVRSLAESLGLEVSHLRTHRGQREIDLIVHSADGRAIGCEVKLSPAIDDHDVRHLNWLHDEMGDLLIDRIVITTGEHAYRRPDGVAIIPLALLGP